MDQSGDSQRYEGQMVEPAVRAFKHNASQQTLVARSHTSEKPHPKISSPGSLKSQSSLECTTKPFKPFLSWSKEFVAWIFSLVIVLAIAVALRVFNGKPLSYLHSAITLNAILSILVTILYLLLSMIISECISQLKWNHFAGGEHPLFDFELFNEASVSSLGSISLLVRRPGCVIAGLGGLISILVIAGGPFVQQILSQGTVPFQVSTASVPILSMPKNRSSVFMPLLESVVDLVAEGTMQGLFASTVETFNVQTTCYNANCTWDPFWTLAIVSECQDVSSHIEVLGPKHWTLPNQFELTGKVDIGKASNITVTSDPIAFSGRGLTVLNLFVFYQGVDCPDQPEAHECMLQFVAQQKTAQYMNGIYTESQIRDNVANNTREGIAVSAQRLIRKNINVENKTQTSIRIADQVKNLDLQMNERYPYNVGKYLSSAIGYASHQVYHPIGNALTASIRFSHKASVTLDQCVDNLAKSLTCARRDKIIPNVLRATTSAYRDIIVYEVSWAWITLPGTLLALVLLFLGLTAWDTHRKCLYKYGHSSLATMAYGCDAETRELLMKRPTLQVIERLAKNKIATMKSSKVIEVRIDSNE